MTSPAGDSDATVRAGAETDADAPIEQRYRVQEAQFAPGTVIAGRYRIASLLGSGGMGEVYRADDGKLGQSVALKFLPARLARDPVLLARLHDEVRHGRQIAHPNVCRIYDIVESGDAHFVSMEYVDGEDLSRLLKRIGRLAPDKAVEIARGIASGLAAAHAKGILHRDLKPANIMIDSHGDARIMDFGLALVAGEDDGTISGTPAYMAPEQFEGEPATVQSDLYALGLVLYELVTGQRAHQARTMPERLRDMTSEIRTPSAVIRDVDPAVERIIVRCIHHDPAQRPASAREVVQALPGGDPLVAAINAGETPSPRLVAAAGSEGILPIAIAASLVAAIAIGIAFLLSYASRSAYLQHANLTRPPEVLGDRASQLLRELGIPPQPYATGGFERIPEHEAWIETRVASRTRWSDASRGLPHVTWWWRESPVPLRDQGILHTPEPSPAIPPLLTRGSSVVAIDGRGVLYSLAAVPSAQWKPRILDWNALLVRAGLDPATMQPVAAAALPSTYADARASWTGRHPENGTPLRVDAAAYRGVPVFFAITAPWNEVNALEDVPFASPGFATAISSLLLAGLAVAVVLAFRNLRRKRGDRAGAWKVASLMFLLALIQWLFAADHEPVGSHELLILGETVVNAAILGGFGWLAYLALEPHVRRRWPELLISWSRLLGGNWRDPMVARDVLIGCTAGVIHAAAAVLTAQIKDARNGITPPSPYGADLATLGDAPYALASLASRLSAAVHFGLVLSIAIVVFAIVFKSRRAAIIAFWSMWMLIYSFADRSPVMLTAFALFAALSTLVTARFGLLATTTSQFAFLVTFHWPIPDSVAWYTPIGIMGPLVVATLGAAAFWYATGGRHGATARLLADRD